MTDPTRPTADPELAAAFERAREAWRRWVHKPAEQVPLTFAERPAR